MNINLKTIRTSEEKQHCPNNIGKNENKRSQTTQSLEKKRGNQRPNISRITNEHRLAGETTMTWMQCPVVSHEGAKRKNRLET